MKYYQHHIGDFNSATRHLTRVERSIYRDLIEMYYDTESPLPADKPGIARKILARDDDELSALDTVLDEFFRLEGDKYRHSRCDEELERWYQKSGKAREAAEKRWESERKPDAQQAQSHSPDANAMPTQCERIPDAMLPMTHDPVPMTHDPVPMTHDPKTLSTDTADGDPYHNAALAMWEKIKPIKKRDNKPNLETWAKHIRHLVELDHIDPETVWRVFEWANRDPFWRPNILSPQKLREKFDTLYAKMTSEADNGPHRQKTGKPENSRRLSAVDRVKRARYGGGA